jgi:hypothetical protein
MGRALLVPLCLAPAAALFLIPAEDPARSAARDAWPARGSEAFASYLPLAEAVLAGPAARVEDGRSVLRLGGVRFVSDRPSGDMTLHLVARERIARGLGEAASELDLEVVIEGELMPEKGGADFLVEQRGGELSLSCPQTESGEVARAAHAAPRRRSLLGRPLWLELTALGSSLIALSVLTLRSRGRATGS